MYTGIFYVMFMQVNIWHKYSEDEAALKFYRDTFKMKYYV